MEVIIYGAITLLVFSLWLFFASRAFRKIILGIVSLLAVAGGIWAFRDSFPSTPHTVEVSVRAVRAWPTEIISADELSLENVTLEKSASSKGYYRISGAVRNNSKTATLLSFDIAITATRCWTARYCSIVGDRTVSVSVGVPPDQTKSFENRSVRLAGVPDNATWKFAVESTYAHRLKTGDDLSATTLH